MGALFESISTFFVANGVQPTAIVPAPSGVVLGDLLVMVGALNFGVPSTINLPAGWTKSDQREPPIGNPKGMLGFKIADAADVVAVNYVVTHSEGSNREWVIAIYRYSGALGLDGFTGGTVNDAPGQTFITSTPHTTTVDNVLIQRSAMWDQTGVEPTSVGAMAGHTQRAFAGGFNEPGPSDTSGNFHTRDLIASPPGFQGPANFQQFGFGGNTRAVLYTVGIAPIVAFLDPAEAEERAREKVADGTWVNAHSERDILGAAAVRAQRFMSPTNPGEGGWVEILDPTAV
jgi:hypothetical protein